MMNKSVILFKELYKRDYQMRYILLFRYKFTCFRLHVYEEHVYGTPRI